MSIADETNEVADYSPPRSWICLPAIVLAVGVRVGFWIGTERMWEDCLITVRHAENAAAGKGLTHQPQQGPPLHGFTSPISVLVPLLGQLCLADGGGFWALRLLTLLAAVVTIVTAWKIALHPSVRLGAFPTAFWLGYLAIEHHQILFGMGGMETQYVVAITLLTLYAVLEDRLTLAGVFCGLALWRPDGVVIVAVVCLVTLLWGRWKSSLFVGGLATAVFLPWILFTAIYYGSPIPHTIHAKDVAYAQTPVNVHSFQEWLHWHATTYLTRWHNLQLWLSPSFGGMGGGTIDFMRPARPVQAATILLSVVGAGRLMFRRNAQAIPVFAAGFPAFLVVMVPVSAGWYLPPWLAVVMLLCATGIQVIADFPAGRNQANRHRLATPRQIFAGVVACGLLGLYLVATSRTIPAERILQREIEDAVRKRAGKWLGEQMKPDEWLSVECLGYFGYYSNAKVLDYPGLASRRSVELNASVPPEQRSLSTLIAKGKPDWIALRPGELAELRRKYPAESQAYVERARFAADEAAVQAAAACLWLPDASIFNDREFIILKRGGS